MLFEGAKATIPMGRLGDTEEDLAPSIIFMLSEGIKYTTGKFDAGGVWKFVQDWFKIEKDNGDNSYTTP